MATLEFVMAGTFRANASVLRPLALARELSSLGHDALCHLLDSPCTRELAEEIGSTPFVRWVPTKKPRDYIKSLRPESEKGIVIQGNVSLVGLACSLYGRRRGRRTISDWDEWLSTKTHCPLSRRLTWRVLEQAARRWSESFVFASADLKAAFDVRYPQIPSTYIPYGMTCARPSSDSADPPPWRPPAGSRWVVYLGSLTRAYRRDLEELRLLVAAAAAARMHVVIIGDGDEKATLEGAFRREIQAGQVHFTGFIKRTGDVDTLLGLAGIAACFLPLEDTMHNRARCPNKLFHYMRARKPIITNRVGEVGRALGPDGFYYDYADPGSLAAAVRRAIGTTPHYDLAAVGWVRRARDFDQWLRRAAPLRN